MKWQSTAFVLLIGAVTAIAQSTPAAKNPPELSDAKFDATRLRTGRFEYRIVRDGKQIATFTITVDKQSDGNFRFTAKGFDQEWESVATSSFQPISAALRIERPKRKETYSMSLTYGRDRVTGSAGTTADNMTNEAKLAEMKPVSAAVPNGTVDQRIDWAAMLASRPRGAAIRTRPAATPPAPTVLVRRGAGQAGLAPDDPGTRFRWSLTGAGS